jgi:protein MpaA
MSKSKIFSSLVYFLCVITVSLVLTSSVYAYNTASSDFAKYISALDERFKSYGWTDLQLRDIPWEYYRTTQHKHPLMFVSFGNVSKNCVLFLGGVHGDELPTVYLMAKLARYVQDNQEMFNHQCIVIAPLLNPDGFFSSRQTRTNASGVDLNRNFPTKDWQAKAIKQWTAKGKNKRYYPGRRPASEQETLFQMALIKRFKPQKILSAHSPLNFFDYDGPSSDLDSFDKWMQQISREIDYPLKKFGYYPGSLGNYAGHERNIFTLTLELPSSDPKQGKSYFSKFQPSILKFINLPIVGSPPNIKIINNENVASEQDI